MHACVQRWQCDMVNRKHLFVTPLAGGCAIGIRVEDRVIFHSMEEGRGWKMDGWKRVGRRHLTWSMLPIYLVARFSTLPQNWKFISGQTDPFSLNERTDLRTKVRSFSKDSMKRGGTRSRERVSSSRSQEWMIIQMLGFSFGFYLWYLDLVVSCCEIRRFVGWNCEIERLWEGKEEEKCMQELIFLNVTFEFRIYRIRRFLKKIKEEEYGNIRILRRFVWNIYKKKRINNHWILE